MYSYTANEGPVRIQYKCLVPIYVFPEMKLRGSVADPDPNPDPDPPDPRVFGPSGSGSGSFYHHAKIVRNTLIAPIL